MWTWIRTILSVNGHAKGQNIAMNERRLLAGD
jgi:hypothetical protein